MQEITTFDAGHDSLIHDLCYNFHGQRLATCASDHRIKIWDKTEKGWILNDSWKAHDAAVLKVVWAHPEFGQVLMSSSFDRTIRIWEELDHEEGGVGRRWVERARLTESPFYIQDIALCPSHLGLKLATVAADGRLRIYEAMDVIHLSQWTLVEDMMIASTHRESDNHFSISWCTTRTLPAMFVVGCGKENAARVYQSDSHNDMLLQVAWAPNLGKSYELIATASRDGFVRLFQLNHQKSKMDCEMIEELSHGAEVWGLEWNMTGTILSSSGDDGQVKMWKAAIYDHWTCISVIQAE